MLKGKKMFCGQGLFMEKFVDFLMMFPSGDFLRRPCIKWKSSLPILCPTLRDIKTTVWNMYFTVWNTKTKL